MPGQPGLERGVFAICGLVLVTSLLLSGLVVARHARGVETFESLEVALVEILHRPEDTQHPLAAVLQVAGREGLPYEVLSARVVLEVDGVIAGMRSDYPVGLRDKGISDPFSVPLRPGDVAREAGDLLELLDKGRLWVARGALEIRPGESRVSRYLEFRSEGPRP